MLPRQARLQDANNGQSILAETTARNRGGTIRRCDADALDILLQRADDSYAQFTQTTESRDVTRQQTVAEGTKEIDALSTRPKQQKPAKKDQDSKSKKLVNGMCYIHAKYGTQAQKCALPEKSLNRNQITPKSEKSQ